jgi:3-ketosteroid 9alpha-monooxygenase subunit A
MYKHGWYKLAFARDLTDPLNPATIGSRRLVIGRTENGIRVFDADCPHRGAHLAYGGKLDRNAVICPFHHYRIGIGRESMGDFQVREYETLVVGGLIFVRLSEAHDNGFAGFITRLSESHTIHPGYVMEIKSPAEVIIENGFDNSHFRPVHGVKADKFVPQTDEQGSLYVRSTFYERVKEAVQGGPAGAVRETPVQLNAFSPFLSVAQLGGRMPMVFITSVNPIGEHLTRLRFSMGLAKKVYGDPPPERLLQSLLKGSRDGIQDDALIWENLSPTAPRHYTPQDAAIQAFEAFCQRFH